MASNFSIGHHFALEELFDIDNFIEFINYQSSFKGPFIQKRVADLVEQYFNPENTDEKLKEYWKYCSIHVTFELTEVDFTNLFKRVFDQWPDTTPDLVARPVDPDLTPTEDECFGDGYVFDNSITVRLVLAEESGDLPPELVEIGDGEDDLDPHMLDTFHSGDRPSFVAANDEPA